jgi:hypothetical protein
LKAAISLTVAGMVLIVAGIALYSVPASLIAAGVLLAGVGLFFNFEE